ncbi:hypothetical protein [Gimesia maris]|uniref:hypothetical protein n=1 Tax=Gimesia maris TaxID=122 RepID=UPI0012B89DB0|nr:hypothetical protein [Gimesia maris]
MPKAVQIAVTGDPGSIDGSQVVVLCDDGSIWAGRPSDHSKRMFWKRLADIPLERSEDISLPVELIQRE